MLLFHWEEFRGQIEGQVVMRYVREIMVSGMNSKKEHNNHVTPLVKNLGDNIQNQ